jgi:D-alanyl-D-alanine carboxypeptidase
MHGAALSLASVLLVTAATDHADARSRKRSSHHHAAKAPAYNPPYASIVVDANTGKVLQDTNADSLRHPASLTKVMTLYLLFEELEAGKLKLTTRLPVSDHAAAQAPSKLNLKPGDSITVENAIRAVVTKSANDVAVVIAEALGGSEPEFAKRMTRKARILGMAHTTYVNASGLPDDSQKTTARDQALLGRAIQERFPKYYDYFKTQRFQFRGHTIVGHNKLLRVDGVDGIKTGYIRDSGFNLLTSMHRDGRYIVAAVFGGRTARSRDAQMRQLIGKYIRVASKERTAPRLDAVAQMKREQEKAAPMQTAAAVPIPVAAPAQTAAAVPVAVATPAPEAASPSPPPAATDPIKPTPVKTVKVTAGGNMRALSAGLDSGTKMMPPAKAVAVTTVRTVKAEVPPPPSRPGILGTLPAKALEAQNSVPQPPAKHSGDYLIQVGAFDDESEAKKRLTLAVTKAKDELDQADPFTEKVNKGEKTLYRARFAGFDKKHAEAACKSLRRGEIPCMLLKN